MKQTLISIPMGCAVAFPAMSYAAADMGSVETSDDPAPGTEAKHGMSHGEVKRIDFAAGKLTIKHGALENLGMDAMTMVFKVKARRCFRKSRPATRSTSWPSKSTARSLSSN